jgi:hypothetical protein
LTTLGFCHCPIQVHRIKNKAEQLQELGNKACTGSTHLWSSITKVLQLMKADVSAMDKDKPQLNYLVVLTDGGDNEYGNEQARLEEMRELLKHPGMPNFQFRYVGHILGSARWSCTDSLQIDAQWQ